MKTALATFSTRSHPIAYFGVSAEACKNYGDTVIFIIPSSAIGTVRGDGAFSADVADALPIANYTHRGNYTLANLLTDRQPRGTRR